MKLYTTSQLNEDIANSTEMAKAVTEAAQRFLSRDWGDVPEEDKELNNSDLKNRDGHVLGRYKSPNGDLYINLEFGETSEEDVALIMYRNEY